MNKWYISEGKESDVVISTRIRLARNIADTNFPSRMTPEQKRSVGRRVYACIKNSEVATDFDLIDMSTLDQAHALSLAERHLVSPEFAQNRLNESLILSHDESVSIMLCEEDHIRIQVMSAGLNLDGAFVMANKIDDVLDSRIDYAFDEKLGYLTSCPTNLGTGMRASVMLHLPALRLKSQIKYLASTVSKLGLTLRGAYGENSSAVADYYQLSNQVTLGISEEKTIENLKAITYQIIHEERAAREALRTNEDVEDSIYRALGTLKSARRLTSNEFMSLISLVRMGVAMGLFDIKYETIGELMASMQPASLIVNANEDMDATLRDKLRAKLVREALEK